MCPPNKKKTKKILYRSGKCKTLPDFLKVSCQNFPFSGNNILCGKKKLERWRIYCSFSPCHTQEIFMSLSEAQQGNIKETENHLQRHLKTLEKATSTSGWSFVAEWPYVSLTHATHTLFFFFILLLAIHREVQVREKDTKESEVN
jgi:hypothetical protein